MAQLTVSDRMAAALEGMLADVSEGRGVDSYFVDADLKAGRFVTQGTEDNLVELPDATGDVTGPGVGFSLLDVSKPPESGAAEYPDGSMVPVLKRGRIWLRAEDAVAAGGAVFVRFSAGVGEELGRVRSDADTADAVALPGARFLTSTTTTNQLALVDVNMP